MECTLRGGGTDQTAPGAGTRNRAHVAGFLHIASFVGSFFSSVFEAKLACAEDYSSGTTPRNMECRRRDVQVPSSADWSPWAVKPWKFLGARGTVGTVHAVRQGGASLIRFLVFSQVFGLVVVICWSVMVATLTSHGTQKTAAWGGYCTLNPKP